MTRINSGVDPKELSTKHLIAEHREIKRIPNVVRKRLIAQKAISEGPEDFCLGKGHVTFFYRKLGYLKNRYTSLHRECLQRGFSVTDYTDAWSDIPEPFMGKWKETPEARKLILNRISEREAQKKPLTE